MNFTLATDIGDIDLLDELDGVGEFPTSPKGQTCSASLTFPAALRISM